MVDSIYNNYTWSKPWPWPYGHKCGKGLAVAASALLILKGDHFRFSCLSPDISIDTAPQTCGLAIEVPFISFKD